MTKWHLNDRTRKFLREVGSIVLGVLIALGIGEVADAIRHRANAHRALAAVRLDMIDNVTAFDLQPIVQACVKRRLATVARILDAARRTGRIGDIGDIGEVGSRSFRYGQWESAVADGDTLYLDKAVVADLTDYHESLGIYRALRNDAAIDWAKLSVLSHAPGRIDDNTLSMARQTVAELRYRTDKLMVFGNSLLSQHRDLGLPVEYTTFNGQPFSREIGTRGILKKAICLPLRIDGRNVERGS